MARRRDAVPEPGAYWLYCPACAACTRCITISGGVSKSGLPCPRFRALYCCASVFISVKTVVPNVATRRAEVDIYNYSPLDYSCGKSVRVIFLWSITVAIIHASWISDNYVAIAYLVQIRPPLLSAERHQVMIYYSGGYSRICSQKEMKQMKNQAAVLYAPHDIRIEERPVPTPGMREVLIEIKAVGVCGSDVHYYEHGKIGSYVVRQPLILGHESSGIIVAVGEGVSTNRIGERVAIEPGIPDGVCHQCRSGHYNLCPNVRFFGTPPIDGAFTNYVTVPESFAYRLPDQMSNEEGALIEPLSVGLWACRKAQLQGADRLLVTGAGPIGMFAMKVALAL